MRMTKTTLPALLLAAALASPALAHNHQLQDAVWDQRGQPVTSAVTGDCVYAANQLADGRVVCGKPNLPLAERTFFFAFDSAKLTPEARAKLDRIAATIKEAGNQHEARIVGFADRIGSNDYNLKLSKRRAQAVQKYLISKGVARTAVADVKAVGEAAPVTECSGDKVSAKLINCLKPDRRVELTIE